MFVLLFMRKLLFVLLVLCVQGFRPLQACNCAWISIEDNYKMASVVFFGKHLGTKDAREVFSLNGQSTKFEQFEVYRFYKGVPNNFLDKLSSENHAKPYIISLISNCNTGCGHCFTEGKEYLVYAQPNFLLNGLVAGDCSRTHEIVQRRFMIPSSQDPDAGKDESYELNRLSRTDTLNQDIIQLGLRWNKTMAEKEEQLLRTQKELKKKSSMSLILSTTTLILLIYVVLDWFKKKKKSL